MACITASNISINTDPYFRPKRRLYKQELILSAGDTIKLKDGHKCFVLNVRPTFNFESDNSTIEDYVENRVYAIAHSIDAKISNVLWSDVVTSRKILTEKTLKFFK